MLFKIDTRQVPEGTVLLIGIRYVETDPDRSGPYAASRPFTYAALKAGGRWYLTGTGKVPQDAGWGAVQRWLDDPRRQVVSIKVVTATETLFETSPGEGQIDLNPGWFDTSQS